MAAVGGFSNFLMGYPGFKSAQTFFNYCEYIMYDNFHAEYLVFCVTLICLCVIVYIYSRIYFEVKRIQTRTPSFPDETIQNRKAMVTTLLIIGTFSICWLPNCIFQIFMIAKIHYDNSQVHELFSMYLLISKYLYILILTNCLFDPIIYAIRLRIVQKGYKRFLQKLLRASQSIKAYTCLAKCRRTNFYRRQTLASEYELATLLSRRASIMPVNSVSADKQQIQKPSDSDFNENTFLADATCKHKGSNMEMGGSVT